MTEQVIDVISIQQTLQDLSDIRDIDRYDLLKDIAKREKMDQETVLAFDEMYYNYTPPPTLHSFKDIILSYILMDNHYVPTIKLDLTARGNNPWDYYIPKNIPPDTVRTVLPKDKKIIIAGTKNINLIGPVGQIIDINNINGKLLSSYQSSMFMTSLFNRTFNGYSNKNTIDCDILKVSKLLFGTKPITLDPEDQAFIAYFKELNIFRKKYHTEEAFLTDVIINRVRKAFVMFPTENYITSGVINSFLIERENHKKRIELKIVKDKNMIKRTVYVNIIKNTFQNKYSIAGKLSTILATLPKDVRKYVEDEYSKKITYNQVVRNNKCPHVRLYKNMNSTTNYKEKKRLLNQLTTFMANRTDKLKYITCNRCRLNIICPHLYKQIQLNLENRAGMSIRNALEIYVDPLIDNYYISFCKICHDELFDANYDEIETEYAGYKVVYPELFKFSWSKLLEIFTTIKLTPRISPFEFGHSLLFHFFPLLIRSKIPTVDLAINRYVQSNELNPALKICVLCYIYGYILNLIRAYIADPKPRYIKISLEEGVTSRNTSKYAEAIMKRFMTLHRSVYNLVDDINLQELFTEIYINIGQAGKNFYIETIGNPASMIFNKIITNTTFIYAMYVANAMKFIKLDLDLSVEYYENMIEKILGKNINQLVRGSQVFDYSNIYVPEDIEHLTKTFDTMKISVPFNFNVFRNIGKSMSGRIIRNYQLYINRVKGGDKSWEDIRDKELVYYLYSVMLSVVGEYIMTATKNYKIPIYTTDPDITALYSENGVLHKWDIIVYSDGTEMPRSTAKLTKPLRVVDYKSSKTSIQRSKTSKLELEKTREAYFRVREINAFFQFYTTRCPEEGIHDFVDDKCTKCGYVDDTESKKYYDKYKHIFKKENQIIEDGEHSEEPEGKMPSSVKSDWKFNKRSIIEASKLISKPIAVIESIGAMENRSVSEILNNQKREPYPISKYSIQLMMVMDHYHNTLCIYNQMRANSIIDYIPLSKFLKSHNIDPSEISNFKNFLPEDLYHKYNKNINSVRADRSKSAEEWYKVYLESLCSFVIEISEINPKAKNIAVYLMNNVINQELRTALSNDKYDPSLFKRKNDNISLSVAEGTDNFDAVFEEEVNPDDIFNFNDISIPINSN